MKNHDQADWLAIIIHFICGAIVGGLTVFAGLMRAGVPRDWTLECLLGVILFGACATGAVYALFQNELWMTNQHHIIPPIPARHSALSRIVLACLAGLSIVGVLISYLLFRP